MDTIGIIGAENSHATHIARTLNVDSAVDGFSVDYIWGETEEFARRAAEEGQIPTIVDSPEEMRGKIDGLIVDHRHPKYHLEAARPFIRDGVPTFIDKPFCYRAEKGREFLAEAREVGTPVTSFSVLPWQESFRAWREEADQKGDVLAASSYGPGDVESQYGGIFFYGVHQVDMLLTAFGPGVEAVRVDRNGNGTLAQLMYVDEKTVSMNLLKQGSPGFGIHAVCKGGLVASAVTMDEQQYLSGIRAFTEMFRTGVEPVPHEHILGTVEVLEALEKSVNSGQTESVGCA